jgi:hypothetical protein
MADLGLDFGSLRDKWRELPQGSGKRIFSEDLLRLDHAPFMETWQSYNLAYRKAEIRRWYHTLYKEFMRGKAVLEVGSGLGLDGVFFLEGGAKHWTFCDIAKTNLGVVKRVCDTFGFSADFVFIDEKFECFENLGMYDVIWANGSLINVPFEFARAECLKILPHLRPGGRWIELCYPQERWIREGRLPFTEWGKVTDGERTPWVEWYDLIKIRRRLFPAPLDVVLDFSLNNSSLNWFDLTLASDRGFDARRKVLDIDVFPSGIHPAAHGDAVISKDRTNRVNVVTCEPIWSYAASFDVAAAIARNDGSPSTDEGFTIEVGLRVSRGHIGILLVGDDISAPICQEYMVAAHDEPATVMIDVPPRAGGRLLVLRNVAAGMRSQFTLDYIKARFVTEARVDGDHEQNK